MLKTFIFVEPRKPLEVWEVNLLRGIFDFWPRPEIDATITKPPKVMNDTTASYIIAKLKESGDFVDGTDADRLNMIKAVYKKRKRGPISQVEWDTIQWKTLDSIADHQQIKDLKQWLKKHASYNINLRNRSGKTILERQTKKQHSNVVEVLMTVPGIIITDEAIANVDNNSLKNKMIRMKLQNEYNSSAMSVAVPGESKVEVREECGHYSINQGEVGICYIVSVITLFRNERSILNWLKSEERSGPLPEIIEMLDTDYSEYDFRKKCPNLPMSMRQAVTQNRTLRSSLKKNGGSAYAIMMYIMNIIDIWTGMSVQTHMETLSPAEVPSKTIKDFEIAFEFGDQQIGYLDISCDFEFSEYTLNLIDFYAVAPLKGFIMRLWNPIDKFNHVIAACVCDDQLHICNSWGKGCQTDIGQVVADLTLHGKRKLWIMNIGLLFSKL